MPYSNILLRTIKQKSGLTCILCTFSCDQRQKRLTILKLGTIDGGFGPLFFMPVAKTPKLTIKQERFARKYVALGCAAEAYRQAYKAERWSDNAVRVEAHRTLQKPNVSLMVDKIKAEQSDFQDITFEEIAAGLRRAADGAAGAGQHSAASQALVALGKLAGLYVEKQKLSVDDTREHLDAVRDLAEVDPEDDIEPPKVVNFR